MISYEAGCTYRVICHGQWNTFLRLKSSFQYPSTYNVFSHYFQSNSSLYEDESLVFVTLTAV